MNKLAEQISVSNDGGTTLWTRPPRPTAKFGDLEARLDQIAASVEILNTSANHDAIAQSPRGCDPAQELGVKAEAARWMLRVAKHLSDPAREKVLIAVLRSIDELEYIVASNVHHAAPPVEARVAHASSRS